MKEKAYKVFVDVWRLVCKYRFQKLNESKWGEFVNDAERLMERYKGTEIENLFRFLFQAVQAFYEEL